jgi:hypothetical protein
MTDVESTTAVGDEHGAQAGVLTGNRGGTANIIAVDVTTAQGIIHAIDVVLLP